MSIDWPLVRWFRRRPEPVIEYDEFWTRYGDTLSFPKPLGVEDGWLVDSTPLWTEWRHDDTTHRHVVEPSPYRFTFGEEAENIARLAATARANQRPADRPKEFHDGGTLDLGVVRDALINEYETFVECFPSWPSCDPGGGVTIGVIRNEPRARRIDLEGVSCA